jgi:hypothetical protein
MALSPFGELELRILLEKKYSVQIINLDYWVDELPTLAAVARYLVNISPASESTSS